MANLCRYFCVNTYPDYICRTNYSRHFYDPPLLYDLHHDPGEIYNLDVKKYQDIMDEINQVHCTHISIYTYNPLIDSLVFGLASRYNFNACTK